MSTLQSIDLALANTSKIRKITESLNMDGVTKIDKWSVSCASSGNKIPDDIVREIRMMRLNGASLSDIAKKYDMVIKTISEMTLWKTYKNTDSDIKIPLLRMLGYIKKSSRQRLTLEKYKTIISLNKNGMSKSEIQIDTGFSEKMIRNALEGSSVMVKRFERELNAAI